MPTPCRPLKLQNSQQLRTVSSPAEAVGLVDGDCTAGNGAIWSDPHSSIDSHLQIRVSTVFENVYAWEGQSRVAEGHLLSEIEDVAKTALQLDDMKRCPHGKDRAG